MKKGPTSRPQEEFCLVCGDRASGYHYNALACEVRISINIQSVNFVLCVVTEHQATTTMLWPVRYVYRRHDHY